MFLHSNVRLINNDLLPIIEEEDEQADDAFPIPLEEEVDVVLMDEAEVLIPFEEELEATQHEELAGGIRIFDNAEAIDAGQMFDYEERPSMNYIT